MYIEESLRFLRALYSCLTKLLDPNGPRTQFDMNCFAAAALNRSEKELNALVSELRLRLHGASLRAFDEVQRKWKEYSDASVLELLGPRQEGGSVWPMEHAFATKEHYDERIRELRKRNRV